MGALFLVIEYVLFITLVLNKYLGGIPIIIFTRKEKLFVILLWVTKHTRLDCTLGCTTGK